MLFADPRGAANGGSSFATPIPVSGLIFQIKARRTATPSISCSLSYLPVADFSRVLEIGQGRHARRPCSTISTSGGSAEARDQQC
jgi:hypothetical protein